jgi:hypothetical protein
MAEKSLTLETLSPPGDKGKSKKFSYQPHLKTLHHTGLTGSPNTSTQKKLEKEVQRTTLNFKQFQQPLQAAARESASPSGNAMDPISLKRALK